IRIMDLAPIILGMATGLIRACVQRITQSAPAPIQRLTRTPKCGAARGRTKTNHNRTGSFTPPAMALSPGMPQFQRRKDGPFVDQRTSFEDTNSTTGSGKTTWVKRGLLVLTSVLVLGMAVGVGLRAVSAAPSPWAS